MDRIAVNALQRARNSKGVTQEKLAEMSGYSVDSIQAPDLLAITNQPA